VIGSLAFAGRSAELRNVAAKSLRTVENDRERMLPRPRLEWQRPFVKSKDGLECETRTKGERLNATSQSIMPECYSRIIARHDY